jgi:hypothetical protein
MGNVQCAIFAVCVMLALTENNGLDTLLICKCLKFVDGCFVDIGENRRHMETHIRCPHRGFSFGDQ